MTKSFLFTTYALVILLSAYLGVSIYEHQTVSRKIEIINEPIIQYEIEEPFYPKKKAVKRRKDMEFLGFTYKGNNGEDIDKVYQNVVQNAEIFENNAPKNNDKSENVKNNSNK